MNRLFALIITCLLMVLTSHAQFYNGSSMRFGKNRVQHEDFDWFFRKYDQYTVYYYEGGKELSLFASEIVQQSLADISQRFEYYYEDQERINVMVYNKIEDFQQGNFGLNEEGDNNIGGVTQLFGRNVFVYFDGNHQTFEQNIRLGIARVFAQQMAFGDTWLEMVKNTALLSIPDWYLSGLSSYFAGPPPETEFLLKDAIKNDRFRRFNQLSKKEADLFGYALWAYVAEIYGEKLIPNILYMSRVGKGIESGFLYVLGVSFKQLKQDMLKHYTLKYGQRAEDLLTNSSVKPLARASKKYSYDQVRISPDGKKAAYVRKFLGKSKVYIVDLSTGKRRCVFRLGSKIDRIEDTGYPLLSWHPREDILSVVYPKSFEVKLLYINLESKEKIEKTLFNIDKVHSFSYASDGKKIILSGISEGVSNLYLYTMSSNTSMRLTNDIYDDLFPIFLQKDWILFSSNRPQDSLKTNIAQHPLAYQKNFDLFGLNINQPTPVLTRYTQTPFDETKPTLFDGERFAYLSNALGTTDVWVAARDSSISHVDTSIHYRFFIKPQVLSQDAQPSIDFSVSASKKMMAEIYYQGGKSHLMLKSDLTQGVEINNNPQPNRSLDTTSSFKRKTKTLPRSSFINLQYQKINVSVDSNTFSEINTNDYRFLQESSPANTNTAVSTKAKASVVDTNQQKAQEPIRVPSSHKYLINYTASDVVSQMDFDFANQLYQHFNGGPYIPPGMGLVFKIGAKDMFEDYALDGGIRFALNGSSTEYFASLEDRSKRWDKKYSYQRQSAVYSFDQYSSKTLTQSVKARFTYPFSEVSSIRLTPSLRSDRGTLLSSDAITLPVEDIFEYWGGIKAEYVWDDSRAKETNIYYGTKAKIFGEHYRILNDFSENLSVLGADIRHSISIWRNLVWVNRFSCGFSFGTRKLVHYLGGVDNWIYFAEASRFDFKTPISNEAGYYFQTITPPLRGFIQNARNGNNFSLINSEVRFPIFKHFISKPIRSEFISNFQIIGFGDIGTAWTGPHPYSEENSFNTQTITDGNVTITLKNQTDPIAAGVGWGIRTTLLGYFIRFDRAWGIENYDFKKPRYYFSLGLDF